MFEFAKARKLIDWAKFKTQQNVSPFDKFNPKFDLNLFAERERIESEKSEEQKAIERKEFHEKAVAEDEKCENLFEKFLEDHWDCFRRMDDYHIYNLFYNLLRAKKKIVKE
jgi:hypothetical protein